MRQKQNHVQLAHRVPQRERATRHLTSCLVVFSVLKETPALQTNRLLFVPMSPLSMDLNWNFICCFISFQGNYNDYFWISRKWGKKKNKSAVRFISHHKLSEYRLKYPQNIRNFAVFGIVLIRFGFISHRKLSECRLHNSASPNLGGQMDCSATRNHLLNVF